MSGKGARTLFIGPLPPPVHGQSNATGVILDRFSAAGADLITVNVSEGNGNRFTKTGRKILMNVWGICLAALGKYRTLYVSTNSGRGMWLTAFTVLAARIRRRAIFVHHHSFHLIAAPSWHSHTLVRGGGKSPTHILLTSGMAQAFLDRYGADLNTLVLNNAGLVDPGLRQVVHPSRDGRIVLGHLSSLSVEKGLDTAIDLAVSLRDSGFNVELLLAGPASHGAAEREIARASAVLGDAVAWLGPVRGPTKRDFFSSLSYFVFPSRYKNEAAPLVVYEAMAAGVPVLATDVGCVGEIVGDSAMVARSGVELVEATADVLDGDRSLDDRRLEARARFDRFICEYDSQMAELCGRVRIAETSA